MADLAHELPDMTLAACGRQLQAAFFRPKADCLTLLMRQAGFFLQDNGAGLAGLFQENYHTSIREHSQERPKVCMRPAPLHSRRLVDCTYAMRMHCHTARGLGTPPCTLSGVSLACQSSCRVISLSIMRGCALQFRGMMHLDWHAFLYLRLAYTFPLLLTIFRGKDAHKAINGECRHTAMIMPIRHRAGVFYLV